MKKQTAATFIAGVVVGVLILCGIFGVADRFWGKDQNAAKQSAEKGSYIEQVSAEAAYQDWKKDAVYTGGDKVVYGNHIYKAKWWTQGEQPDKADVWEDTGESPIPTAALAGKNQSLSSANANQSAAKQGALQNQGNQFKIVGYFPSWRAEKTDKLRYDVLTHINYAFAIPKKEGGLRPLENADTAKKIIAEAHKNDVKVLLAVGGWSYQDVPLEATFIEATNTTKKVKALGDDIIKMCDEYGFDGVDMDWEHPRVDGNSAKQYEELMLYLAERLHAKGKLLTSAVLSGATVDGNVYYDAAAHSDAVLQAVDWINVMAYDGGDGERHSPYQYTVDSGNYWHNIRKVPAEKVVVGVPFYARPSWASYEDLLKADGNAWKKDTCQYQGMEACYNGVETMKKKTKYAKTLGGIMIWEVTQDTSDREKSLMTAIDQASKES